MSVKITKQRELLERVVERTPLSREEIFFLYTSPEVRWDPLAEAARALREQGKGKTITYSPKVFLPLTNLCRDRCGYCTFRRDPADAGARWMEPEEVLAVARAGEALGCREALLSLGDRPEAAFAEAREWLRQRGFRRTLEYVAATSDLLLEQTSLFPHSNPGLMARSDLARLKDSNASLGLMLESTATRLFTPGGAHADAVDKRPHRRWRTLREAGELKIPFTTGILVGIGETAADIVDSLWTIRELHKRYGHIQEVIVQNFAPKPGIPMQHCPPPQPQWFARTVAIARLVLGPQMNIQAPPNLSLPCLELLLDSGLNDWGGISPLTLDYINPEAPWPAVERLEALARNRGLQLRERLAVYPEYARHQEYFSPRVWKLLQARTDAAGYPLRQYRGQQALSKTTGNTPTVNHEVARQWPSSAM
ncbi:MAG: 7,8-didemethyl-8-hydroxy-5-deazariboflavin synthase CofG [Acidobacteria bacterium]|nr:7,8-didemethyl-8-hydroxy-5-deazariboflavin synthase CofG [Acidobacteriota bacterium]